MFEMLCSAVCNALSRFSLSAQCSVAVLCVSHTRAYNIAHMAVDMQMVEGGHWYVVLTQPFKLKAIVVTLSVAHVA